MKKKNPFLQWVRGVIFFFYEMKRIGLKWIEANWNKLDWFDLIWPNLNLKKKQKEEEEKKRQKLIWAFKDLSLNLIQYPNWNFKRERKKNSKSYNDLFMLGYGFGHILSNIRAFFFGYKHILKHCTCKFDFDWLKFCISIKWFLY